MDRQKLRYLRLIAPIVLVGGGLILAFTTVILSSQRLGDLSLNIATELVGAGIAYGLFELVIRLAEKRMEEEEGREARKKDLIRKMGSGVKDTACSAAEDLREEGWLTDGSLRGAALYNANLEGAYLWEAYLQGAHLGAANLRRAVVMDANLRGVILQHADLQGSTLRESDLDRANLVGANLQGAILEGASLKRADLSEANLRGADVTTEQLAQAESLKGAILPDGTKLSPDAWSAEFEGWRKTQEE